MSAYHIRYIDGRYQVYATSNGKDQVNVGPRWMTPKEAGAYVDKVDAEDRAATMLSAMQTTDEA